MQNKTALIIMSAGAGTRFKSNISKLLHNFAGKPVISYLVDLAKKNKPAQTIFVVSHQKEELIKIIGDYDGFYFAEQKILDGTAGAVRVAIPLISNDITKVVIMPGDTPTIPAELISELMSMSDKAVVVGTRVDSPGSYGRIKTNDTGCVVKIIEGTDLSKDDEKINLVNTSIYCFDRNILEQMLKNISKNKNKNEFYLTDLIELISSSGEKVACIDFKDAELVLGPNDRRSLVEQGLNTWLRRAYKYLDNGVTVVDPSRVYIDEGVVIEKDVSINPDVYITGTTIIEENVQILEGCRINNSKIAKDSIIGPYVVMDGCNIGIENKIGPFTYLRPGTNTDAKVKIGAFAETKNVKVGEGSKIPHLSYVGDASLGKGVNIGCGVITCNYDGVKKHHTSIGDNVFIGSDSQLVAPVNINDGAYVAAGTTVTAEVPSEALAISRVKQKNLEGYATKIKNKKSVKQGE